MTKTPTTQKTPPRKSGNKRMELERRSPRGHKSSKRETEVNTQKRGIGPQGRGGKVSTRPEPEGFSSESSESESDEDDEGNDGRYGIKKKKMRQERSCYRCCVRRSVWSWNYRQKCIRWGTRHDRTKLAYEWASSGPVRRWTLRTACLPSCENSYFRGTSSSGMDGRTTSLIVIIACHRCACADYQFRREVMRRIFGREWLCHRYRWNTPTSRGTWTMTSKKYTWVCLTFVLETVACRTNPMQPPPSSHLQAIPKC